MAPDLIRWRMPSKEAASKIFAPTSPANRPPSLCFFIHSERGPVYFQAMETPPASEIKAARQRLYAGAVGYRPGTVILSGTPYPAAVSIGRETFGLTDRGQQPIQNVQAIISKEELAVAPKQGASLKVGALSFKVVEVDGHNAGDEGWHLTGQRTPGGDG